MRSIYGEESRLKEQPEKTEDSSFLGEDQEMSNRGCTVKIISKSHACEFGSDILIPQI